MINDKYVTPREEKKGKFSKTDFLDIALYGEVLPDGTLAAVSQALAATARQLTESVNVKAALVVCGDGLTRHARGLLRFGPDRVFVYDNLRYKNAGREILTAIFAHYIEEYKPSVILFPDTLSGRYAFEAALQATGNPGAEYPPAFVIRANKDLVFDSAVFDQLAETRPQLVLMDTANLPEPAVVENRRGELVLCEIPEPLR